MSAHRNGMRDGSGEPPEVEFRLARLEDVTEIVDILFEAAAWTKARGVD